MSHPTPRPPDRLLSVDAGTPVVHAAGAVCWRLGTGGTLETLLVHRPAYDDWSWPKGKLDPGEGAVEAAYREVAEETGLRVRLGVPLPTAHYRLSDSLDKRVTYWAAHVTGDPLPAPPNPREIDRCEWVSPDQALSRLTRRGDRQQLTALVAAHDAGALDTWPLVVLRHAVAHPRTVWGRDDSIRPLVGQGQRQAAALVPFLRAWAPDRVVTSPWKRCTDTVRPYVDATSTPVRTRGRLSEDGHRRNPGKVAELVGRLLDKGQPVLVCTHRPVLGTLLGAIAGRTTVGLADVVPARDPFLDAAEVLVAHVSRSSGRVVGVEQHVPARR